MNKERRNRLKEILLEAFIVVGFALVLTGYLATVESLIVIILSEAIASIFNGIKAVKFLPIFRTLLIPNFIVLHIEFARMFREREIKE